MLEMKCKQCGKELTAKNESAMIKATKAHFKTEHALLPVSDAMIEDSVKKNAKTVR